MLSWHSLRKFYEIFLKTVSTLRVKGRVWNTHNNACVSTSTCFFLSILLFRYVRIFCSLWKNYCWGTCLSTGFCCMWVNSVPRRLGTLHRPKDMEYSNAFICEEMGYTKYIFRIKDNISQFVLKLHLDIVCTWTILYKFVQKWLQVSFVICLLKLRPHWRHLRRLFFQ